MKTKYLILSLLAFVWACSPEAPDKIVPDEEGNGQEQTGTSEGQEEQGGEHSQTFVEVEEAGHITSTSARLYGGYAKASGSPLDKGFEWGASESELDGILLSESVIAGASGNFFADLSGLEPNTEYFYRAYIEVAENGANKTYYSEVASFRTEAVGEGGEDGGEGGGQGDDGGDEVTTVSQPGWYELPKMDITKNGKYMVNVSDNSVYYAWHICPDVNGPGGRKARNYTVCYSAEHFCPLWVAAPRHDMYAVKNTNRTDAYQVDPDVPSEYQYKSKDTGGECNKGHMLGSEERRVSRATNVQVFYYTNIAPQLSANFNTGGGRWNVLEDYVEEQVCADTLYETLGCYFEPYTDAYGQSATPTKISFGGRTNVTRPSMYYYVLLRTKSGNTGKALKDCTRDELKCVAFVRAHVNVRQAVTRNELMSVSDLEKITGFTYFANVPQAPKDSYNPSDWNL